MAKISARGCRKLAAASKLEARVCTLDDSEMTVRTRLVLRSDDRVLRAVDIRYGDRWNRGGYSIIGALAARDGRSPVERFHRYAEQRGFAPETVR